MTLIRIPAGTFRMGSPANERGRHSSEGPVHVVTLTKDFYLSRYEVTQREWDAIMGSAGGSADDTLPVVNVSWNDIAGPGGFIDRLNLHIRSVGQGDITFRLPSEAEWEYAARGGTQTRFAFGDALTCDDLCGPCPVSDDYMWWCANTAQLQPVGRKSANQYGLFDMHGNAFEWVNDWSGTYTASPVADPRGPATDTRRIIRSGAWFAEAATLRSAQRYANLPDHRSAAVGFRIAAQVK